ncbi:3-hydroxyacyl-CoA dehydrogenase NAD-binding domain-containing protein [Teichococcus cervicalis]|uniref:3-hydroxyacyl-CoA dehydrogenase, NAD binding domain protein n=2 Tax=Teichococcus cervicalis TaxID=204525 RepID=D5RL11_9PROT|nr:3-hydroxyacyl-CoA dehydrogenase NAD-binding domain-containing protein [Pseudoroseomonas cervicalis]EFH11997.1 3-hydroxyacyl-CoA dehydrogenase, NAD binding domain protein [Pseudoroseomonas cervicalis ATCC 49957]
MAEAVSYRVEDGVAVATIDNPPVNALSAPVRAGVMEAVRRAAEDPAVAGLVVLGAGRAFIAGADITEFGKPPIPPALGEVVAALEASPKPAVAAIQGVAFGGGLELALGCDARLVGPKAQLGLPEVKLGLLPGAGGTQRTPRLIGAAAALPMIASGDPVPAEKAVALGLADALVEGDLLAAAKAKVKALAAAPLPPRLNTRTDRLDAPGAREEFEQAATALAKRAREEPQVAAIIQSVRNAFELPLEQGLAKERDFFVALRDDPRSKALRHVFFAEREAARIPGLPREVKPRAVNRAAVLGGGTMGTGIAMSFANAGIPVRLIETDAAALERALKRVADTYAVSVKRGSLAEEARAKRLALIEGAVGLENAAGTDLVVEAVFEELELKKEIFAKLGQITAPGTVLASNTSYLDINAMGAASGRPGDVLGMHFFSPANVMKLLEVVRAEATAPDALATAMEVGRKLAKVPVVVGVCHGFVGNRMLAQRTRQVEALLQEGATPAQLDKALTDFGFRMGPCAMSDLAGLDIGWRIRKATGAKAPVADALCEAGRLGQKTGKGYYAYPEGARAGVEDPEAQAIIEGISAQLGITRRAIGQDEILERLVFPMINEGARILEEGIAARPGDIDIVWLYGYNWPAWRGGPMHHADAVGLAHVAQRLAHYAEATGDDSLRPAPLLARLAESGQGFATLKAEPAKAA